MYCMYTSILVLRVYYIILLLYYTGLCTEKFTGKLNFAYCSALITQILRTTIDSAASGVALNMFLFTVCLCLDERATGMTLFEI